MTFIVTRDAEGVVSINYTEGGASISLHGQPDTFSDSFAAPEKAAELAAVPDENADKVDEAAKQPKAFKCPACGAEYDEQVECTNQHPAEQTLPTEQVIGGAASTNTTDTATPPAPVAPAPDEKTPAGPTWPA